MYRVLIVEDDPMVAMINEQYIKRSKLFQVAFTAGVCGFMVQAMTDYSFYNYRVMLIFWVYLALGMVVTRRKELPEGSLIQ